MRKTTNATFIASQASQKDVKKFIKSLSTKKDIGEDYGADSLLSDFKGGFKGLM